MKRWGSDERDANDVRSGGAERAGKEVNMGEYERDEVEMM